MARLTLRHRLARLNPFVWIGAVAVIGALVAWPLGGWETVELESTKIPQVQPGTLVEGQQYSVQVDRVEVTDVHPDGFSEPEPGWEYLAMNLTVTNMTAATQLSLNLGDDYSGVVTVDDGAVGWGTTLVGPDSYVVSGDAYLVADGTFLPDLQPRLPEPLVLLWDVPAGTWEPGDTLTVGIVDRSPFQSTLEVGIRYGQPQVVATVQLVVEQGAVAPPPDEAGDELGDEVVP